jgi:hypothetical protein
MNARMLVLGVWSAAHQARECRPLGTLGHGGPGSSHVT